MSLHGSPTFNLINREVGWSLGRGAYEVLVYECPLSKVEELIASMGPGFTDYNRSDDGELATVKFSYSLSRVDGVGQTDGNDGVIRLEWELHGNDLEKSLWEHPKVAAETAGLNYSELAEVRRAVQDIFDGVTPTITLTGEIATLALKLARGVEAFTVSQFVLRKVVLVRPNSTLRPAIVGVNKVFTYNDLLEEEPTLADENLVKAAGLETLFWLKRTPTVTPTSEGLWEIAQEYWGANKWDDWAYSLFNPPPPEP